MKIREFVDQAVRIFRMAKKPTPEEFKRTAKITGLGITILGTLGFIIHMIVWFIQNGGQ
ncbi:MAG: protein translocase SEC61 complex subunit gamma [Candidatus Diapherotrites archaeon]|jgi:protein transport protein SEC61 subunit gamma-like protein|nr:protein translocase SEC61 complex subunit gamma [Candidatus Diapherotrites archaeon]